MNLKNSECMSKNGKGIHFERGCVVRLKISKGASCTFCDSHYTCLVGHRSDENKNMYLVTLYLSVLLKKELKIQEGVTFWIYAHHSDLNCRGSYRDAGLFCNYMRASLNSC